MKSHKGGRQMGVQFNIAERPFTVTLKRGKDEITVILWAESREALRDRLEEELSEKTEIVKIKEGRGG